MRTISRLFRFPASARFAASDGRKRGVHRGRSCQIPSRRHCCFRPPCREVSHFCRALHGEGVLTFQPLTGDGFVRFLVFVLLSPPLPAPGATFGKIGESQLFL